MDIISVIRYHTFNMFRNNTCTTVCTQVFPKLFVSIPYMHDTITHMNIDVSHVECLYRTISKMTIIIIRIDFLHQLRKFLDYNLYIYVVLCIHSDTQQSLHSYCIPHHLTSHKGKTWFLYYKARSWNQNKKLQLCIASDMTQKNENSHAIIPLLKENNNHSISKRKKLKLYITKWLYTSQKDKSIIQKSV